jgi:hypothetical protein
MISIMLDTLMCALVGAFGLSIAAFQITAFWWTRNSGIAMRQLLDQIHKGTKP